MKRPSAVAGAILAVGGVVYGLAVGGLGLTFNSTPLIVGLVAIAAGVASRSHRLVLSGLPLAGWGSAVLAVSTDVIDRSRTAPAYLLGLGLGLLLADWYSRRTGTGRITGALLSALSGAASFYFAYDFAILGRWTLWAVALVVWGAWEAVVAPAVRVRSSS